MSSPPFRKLVMGEVTDEKRELARVRESGWDLAKMSIVFLCVGGFSGGLGSDWGGIGVGGRVRRGGNQAVKVYVQCVLIDLSGGDGIGVLGQRN